MAEVILRVARARGRGARARGSPTDAGDSLTLVVVPPFCPFIRDADFAARAPWVVAERRLLDYLLVCVQEGECVFTLDGAAMRPLVGQFCLVRPGQRVHLRGRTHTVTPYAHFDATYNARRGDSFATRPGQLDLDAYGALLQPPLPLLVPLPSVFFPPDGDAARARWRALIERWNGGNELSRFEANAALGVLLLEWARHFAELEGRVQPASKPLGWVESYLGAHLGEAVAVEVMARRARLSIARFHVVFKREFGTTPARYLTALRVRHAGELLQTTDWTLAHIAHLCGFADVHSFAKAFKRVHGCTPGEFRHGVQATEVAASRNVNLR